MKKDTNRNRNSLMYNDEDENTSKPKHEKLIDLDKKRIESEKDDKVSKQKDVSMKDTDREEASRKKIEASSSKFSVFLDAKTENRRESENNDQNQTKDQLISQASTASVESDKSSNTVVPVTNSPRSSASPSSSPQKQNIKRKSSSEDESSSKRNKPSSSNEQKLPLKAILQGVVFVISGIQVIISFVLFNLKLKYIASNSMSIPMIIYCLIYHIISESRTS